MLLGVIGVAMLLGSVHGLLCTPHLGSVSALDRRCTTPYMGTTTLSRTEEEAKTALRFHQALPARAPMVTQPLLDSVETLMRPDKADLKLVHEIGSLVELECRVRACKTLAVVKYYQQNCRLCRALAPKYEQWARDWQGQAEFFAVNLRGGRDIFIAHKVTVAPYVCFFAGEAGKVYGASCGSKGGGSVQVRSDLASHLEPTRLAALRAVHPAIAREPAQAFVSLVTFLRALGSESARHAALGASAVTRPPEETDAPPASLSEAQLMEAHSTFAWLDPDGTGVITLADAVRATCVLSASCEPPDGQPLPQQLAPARLAMYRLCRTEEALGVALRRLNTADAGGPANALSRSAFVRLMARQAASDRKRAFAGRPTVAQCAAYSALCPDGAESVPREHTRAVLLQMAGPNHADVEQMEQALAAFEEPGSDGLTLKAFVNLVGS